MPSDQYIYQHNFNVLRRLHPWASHEYPRPEPEEEEAVATEERTAPEPTGQNLTNLEQEAVEGARPDWS